MRLRDVRIDDADAYVRMWCDPTMTAELGGPMPRDGIEDEVACDVAEVASGTTWICMILSGDDESAAVAGSVTVWSQDHHGVPISRIGWMVLPEFQGRGLGKGAVRHVLERARDEDRWGIVHAFPAVTNAASNGVCRSLGFTLVGVEDLDFADSHFRTNHWIVDPKSI